MNPKPPTTQMTPAQLHAVLEQQRQLSLKLWNLLQKIAPADRPKFARSHLKPNLLEIVRYFDSLPPDRLAKTVLYLSTKPQTRETRLAVAAKLAGWEPLLVYTGSVKYAASEFFSFHAPVPDMMQLIFVSWLFPGPLIHIFSENGTNANLLCLLKNRPTALDLYDTRNGWQEWSSPVRLAEVQNIKTATESAICQAQLAEERQSERRAIANADGLTHRDMRVVYLHRHNGFALPAHNIFIHDPLLERTPVQPRKRAPGEIHVVSVGSITNGDVSILRCARALCQASIHLHAYFNPEQKLDDPGVIDYWQLARQSPYFHVEMPVFGQDYWKDLQRYDFGMAAYDRLVYGDPLLRHTDDYEWGCGSSRLTDYIQMNFGIILSPELRFQHFWARHYSNSVTLASPEFLRNPRPVLEAALAAKQTCRPKDLTPIMAQAVAPRLGKFYTELAARVPGRSRPRRANPALPKPRERDFASTLLESARNFLQLPPANRLAIAQAQREPELIRFNAALAKFTPARLAKTVLFISVQPHTRETRLAEAARLAGWEPILIHLHQPKYAVDDHFKLHAAAANWAQLIVLSWLFRGPLMHLFTPNGSLAEIICRIKNRPLIIDLYDTCSGVTETLAGNKLAEREAIALADGLTHRDLRIKYLHRYNSYRLPAHNLFIHDPLVLPQRLPMRPRPAGEIRVVSVGWIATGSLGVLRLAQALCAARVHFHVYLAHVQNWDDPAMAEYRQLAAESEYFHPEQPVYGEAYWQALQRYDFGLSALDGMISEEPFPDYTNDYMRGCGSSRLSDYISANLGIIVAPLIHFQSFWARRYASACVSATPEFLDDPRPFLEAALASRATRTAKDIAPISIPAIAPRLGRFYEQVAAGTPARQPRLQAKPVAPAFAGSIEALLQVPPAARRQFARVQYHPLIEDLVRYFDAIPSDRLAKTVLFVSTKCQMREVRLAASARQAGWNPVLVHLGRTPYVTDEYFAAHAQSPSLLQLILCMWLFPGPLVHVFCAYGSPAHILCRTKSHPVILDLYDTRAGWEVMSTPERRAALQNEPDVAKFQAKLESEVREERLAIAAADGLTHRDLRIRYLQKLQDYQVPAHNILIHDPLFAVPPAPPCPNRPGQQIRVVSIGSITNGDVSIIRIARSLCAARIHLHVYLNLEQRTEDAAVAAYVQLAKDSPYFHIEKPVIGDAYWRELQRYDFGLSAFDSFVYKQDVPGGPSEDYLQGSGSSRLTDYIQMNMGIILCSRFHFQCFLAKRFAPVLIHGTEELFDNPRPVLEAALAAKAAARPKDLSSLTIAATAPRLARFYAEVIAAHSSSGPRVVTAPAAPAAPVTAEEPALV